ncbi:MAG: DUF2304 domain-containing protein [Wenzhouxiangellaceae bacterium]|nr:DUF2304 domain-containing protein [Wenzhouxiangellaceae bacterium]
MITMQLFAEFLALVVIVLIVWLIRRDRLPISHAIWWLAVAAIIALLGFFPNLLDALARAVGISYPPSLLFILAILTLLIKVLLEDLEVSTNRRRLLRLAQKTSILEEEIRQLQRRLDERDKN